MQDLKSLIIDNINLDLVLNYDRLQIIVTDQTKHFRLYCLNHGGTFSSVFFYILKYLFTRLYHLNCSYLGFVRLPRE
jgi:hypothetical protein